MKYADRSLAITPHACARFRERTSASYLDNEWVRMLIARGVERGVEEPHYVAGQVRVRFRAPGVDGIYAIIGRDETGWSSNGRAVVTVLTAEQVATHVVESQCAA